MGWAKVMAGCGWLGAYLTSLMVATLCIHLSPAYALDYAAAGSALNSAVTYLNEEQSNDGSWGENDDIRYIATAASVEALSAANQFYGPYYFGVAWLENHATTNVDYAARKIIALTPRD